MKRTCRHDGFSLTEVLLATGILAMGFVLIAMIFPAGIKLTSLAAEKTLGPAIAEEAIAKMQIYGLDPLLVPQNNLFYVFPGQRPTSALSPQPHLGLSPQSEIVLYKKLVDENFDPATDPLDVMKLYEEITNLFQNAEGVYPSMPAEFYQQNPDQSPRYSWSAVYRHESLSPQLVVRVFVCRKTGNTQYYGLRYNTVTGGYESLRDLEFPMPIPVNVTFSPTAANQFTISTTGNSFFSAAEYQGFFKEGTRFVDDTSGTIYQVIEKKDSVYRIQGTNGTGSRWVWVVPPGAGSGRNPCVYIYESVIQ